MENYKHTSYYNNHTISKSTKQIHTLWNENLECGVIYHTSTKTGKVTYIGLQIGLHYKSSPAVYIQLPTTTSTDDAVDMLSRLYSKMYFQIKTNK